MQSQAKYKHKQKPKDKNIMAHELDENEATGRKAYFGVEATAWHGEGFTLDYVPDYAEAIRLSGAGYEVQLRPLHVQLAGMMQQSPIGKAVVRTDRNVVLGIVGDDYRPIQNEDAFRVLLPLLENGTATIETGGTLRYGADAWMLVKFNVQDPVVQEVFTDEVIPYACIATNHSGRRKVVCMETPIRVVCANTLTMAFAQHGRAVAVSHRGAGGTGRLVDAATDLFSGIVDRYHKIAEAYKSLKETMLTVEQFTASVLDVASPLPSDPEAPRFQSVLNRSIERRNAIHKAWTDGKGHTGEPSAWYAYNGAVEVIDHDTEMYRVRGSRLSSLMDGSLHTVKNQVLESLLAVK